MFDHAEHATRSFECAELQTKVSLSVNNLVLTRQAANSVNNFTSFTAYEQGSFVSVSAVSHSIEYWIQCSFQLGIGSGSTSVSGVGSRRQSANCFHQTIHSCQVLLVDDSARLLTEDQSTFDSSGMEVTAVCTRFSNQRVTYNWFQCS